MFSLRGKNKDGIEVYETSEEIKKLPYTERKQRFLDIMKNEYRGRTAKFVRNGHAYYATFEESDVNKNIYGDKRSDPKGWKAKINVGADGNIFELVENAQYNGSLHEKGKKIAAHKGVGYWDYFIKMVQVDDKVFDLVANVRKKADGAYVYSIQLNQNKTIEASPPRGSLLRALSGVPNASNQKVAQNDDDVKEKFSDRDSRYLDAVNRGDMAELLNAEVDKRKNYKFPKEVYADIEKKFGENSLDNSTAVVENEITEDQERGEAHDNRRIRKGTAENAGSAADNRRRETYAHDGGNNPENTGDAQTAPEWRNLDSQIRKGIREDVLAVRRQTMKLSEQDAEAEKVNQAL